LDLIFIIFLLPPFYFFKCPKGFATYQFHIWYMILVGVYGYRRHPANASQFLLRSYLPSSLFTCYRYSSKTVGDIDIIFFVRYPLYEYADPKCSVELNRTPFIGVISLRKLTLSVNLFISETVSPRDLGPSPNNLGGLWYIDICQGQRSTVKVIRPFIACNQNSLETVINGWWHIMEKMCI